MNNSNDFNHIDFFTDPDFLTGYGKVLQFMKVGNQEINSVPKIPNDELLALRLKLILEEVSELFDAAYGDYTISDLFKKILDRMPEAEASPLRTMDFNEIIDALTDINYVTYGGFASFGVDADLAMKEVHASNMSKFGENGEIIKNEIGKVLKGPNYKPPDWRNVFNHPGY